MFYSAQRAACFSSFRGTLTNGFSLLLRAKCDGQMLLLKGLKAEYVMILSIMNYFIKNIISCQLL